MDKPTVAQAKVILAHMRANQNADPMQLLASIVLQLLDMYLTAEIADAEKKGVSR